MITSLKGTLLAASVLLGYATAVNAEFTCPTGLDDPGIGATPFTAGPVNPKNGGALWLQDSNGLRLELCLDDPQCFFDPVDEDNPFSERVGFGPEAFWWAAEAAIDIDQRGNFPGFSALVVMGAEFAWLNEDPTPGEQFLFTRLRFRLQVPEIGTYYVTHPYGREVVVVDEDMVDDGDIDGIFVNFDIEFSPEGQGQGRIGPFLTWDPSVSPDAPEGYIAGVENHEVTGSPCGTNYFEVRAVAPDGIRLIDLHGPGPLVNVVSTDMFSVMGKYATRAGVNVTRATYTRGDWDPGMELFATTLATYLPQDLEVSATPYGSLTPITAPMVPGAVDPDGILQSYIGLIRGDFPAQTVTVTNTSDPIEPDCVLAGPSDSTCESAVRENAVDTVNISEAYYNRMLNEIEIVASTTDDLSTCPDASVAKLQAYADDGTYLGDLTIPTSTSARHQEMMLIVHPGLLENDIVPPARVTVTSCFGGASDISSVDVGLCERAGQSQNCGGG